MKKTIGIIGGMGPLATCDLFRKILDNTDAPTDQDNVRVVIDSNTEIPDRTAAILHGGADPVSEMVRSAVLLEGMGADVLIMPCNTAHYFYGRITPFIRVPLLHMIRKTAKETTSRGIRTAGLLATDGTVESGVYKKAFDEEGISLLAPCGEDQKAVMDVIYDGVKAGKTVYDTAAFRQAVEGLLKAGAEAVILGCTELPLAFSLYGLDYPSIDPTTVLARSALRYLGVPMKSDEIR